MTTRQAELINIMLSQHYNSATYKDAYSELRGTCSDALVQPTVTVSASGTANPPPPSTPQPLGPEWRKERQAEAIKEQIDIIADKNLKIETLNNQVALLMKRIKEDREHWDNKAVIDKGYREHNNELVAANGEIYEALRHWGLEQSEPCSLVNNVKHVIQLCAERGKAHFEQKDKIERLNDQIDSQSKVIAELTNQRDQWEKLAAKRSDEMNRRSDMIDIMEKQGDRKDKEIKALKATCDIRQGFIDKGREVSDELRKQLMEKSAEIEELKKDRNASIIASNQILGSLNQTNLRQYDGSLADNVVDVIKQCVLQGKQIGVMNMDLIRKDKEIGKLTQWHADSIDQVNKLGRELGQKIQENERLKKELEVAGKKQKAIIKAGNDLKYLLRDVFPNDYPLMYGCVSYCTHYISLWDDNTAPQSSAG